MRKSKKNPESGLSLVELMIAMGIASIGILGYVSIEGTSVGILNQENERVSIVPARESMFRMLDRYDTFQNSVTADANFNCVRTKSSCAAGARTFILRDASGAAYYDGTSANSGFQDNGVICASATPTPNRLCPIRATLEWSPFCTSATCETASVIVSVEFQVFGESAPKPLYGFTLLKSVY
jgi:prepilin-type N-terminal cleavage/methylation domain-containing protein